MSDPIDAALDELYAVAPDAFVETRTRLVGELRGAGDKEAAKALGSARRPTVAAWALNQVARSDAASIDEFLRVSDALRDAQQRAVAGDAADLRDASRAQRDVLDRVFAAATAAAGADPTSAVASQIAGTLQAASTSLEAGEALRAGRLVKELQAGSGFPGADGLPDTTPVRTAPRAPAGRPRPPVAGDAEVSERVADVADLERARERRAARERAERDLEAARSELEQARQEADAAEAAAADARTRADDLARDAADAKEAARRAQQEHTTARRHADRLATAVARLERALPPEE